MDTAFIEAIETLESGSKDRSTGLKFPKLSFKRRDKRDANYDDDSRGKSPTPGKEPTNNDEEKEKKNKITLSKRFGCINSSEEIMTKKTAMKRNLRIFFSIE